MTLALCCVAQAEGSVSVGLEAQPALVILDDETRTAPYSYIAEYQLTYGQQDEYFYPSLDTVLTADTRSVCETEADSFPAGDVPYQKAISALAQRTCSAGQKG